VPQGSAMALVPTLPILQPRTHASCYWPHVSCTTACQCLFCISHVHATTVFDTLSDIPCTTLAARGSDDASAKGPGGSPKQTSTTVTTVALADKSVTLASRFPGIKLCREPAGPSLQADALEAVTKALLEPALKIMSLSQLRTEAARVHVAGSVSGNAACWYTTS
jgi:hypothetical protein